MTDIETLQQVAAAQIQFARSGSVLFDDLTVVGDDSEDDVAILLFRGISGISGIRGISGRYGPGSRDKPWWLSVVLYRVADRWTVAHRQYTFSAPSIDRGQERIAGDQWPLHTHLLTMGGGAVELPHGGVARFRHLRAAAEVRNVEFHGRIQEVPADGHLVIVWQTKPEADAGDQLELLPEPSARDKDGHRLTVGPLC